MPYTHDIRFTLNNKAVRTSVRPEMTTLKMLREVMGLTGTKSGCEEGECGACTIIVDGQSRNACLMFAIDCDGRDVVTIEGLEAEGGGLTPLQQRFVEHWATQCGFCTPGMVMQAHHLLQRHPGASRADIARGLEGNLCRCTGYSKIVDAVAAAMTAERP